MDLRFSAEDERFRREFRSWLDANLPTEWRSPRFWHDLDPDTAFRMRREWEMAKADAGWAGINVPAEYGGYGGTAVQQGIHDEEMARARAPQTVNRLGYRYLLPTLLALGTEEQKRRLIRPLLRCETIWCQGFSEPDAGSDLASVRTRAVRDGDHFVVHGQKVWTTQGTHADWMFALVRTDPEAPRHRGLTFLLIDLRTSGVEVRPLRQLTGESEFGEVFFDGARVPVDNVVGEIDGGWDVAMTLLAFERGGLPFAQYVTFRQELAEIIQIARRVDRHGRPAAEDPVVRQRIAQSFIDLELLRLRGLHVATQLERGQDPGFEASVTKLHWSETHQDLGELFADVTGLAGHVADPDVDSDHTHLRRMFLWSRAETIFGGTSQIQRNVIAERLLGLPR